MILSNIRRLALTLALLALSAGACGLAKSEAELATDSLNKGVTLQNSGKTDEAARAYFESLSHDTRAYLAFYNLGQMARVAGRNAIAEGYYRSALDLQPSYAPALFGLAVVRSSVPGAVPEVLDLYKRTIDNDPNMAAAHYNYGLNLKQVGRGAEGDAEIAKARQLDPSLPAVPASTPGPAPTPAPTPTATARPSTTPSPSPTR